MEVKDRILEGASVLYRTYGIKAVTMDTLASHLGISKRTIYEVFSDKDEILSGVLKLMTKKHKEMVTRILEESENSIYAIFRLLEINMDHFQEMSPVFQSDLRKYHYDVLMKKIDKSEIPDYRDNIKFIQQGIAEELFRNDINPDLVNRCLISLGKSTMDTDLYPFEEFTRKEVVRNVFINYLRGISTKEGINLISQLEDKF